MKKPLFALSAFLCAALSSFAATVYVKPSACGLGDGSSWANAKGDLRDAILNAQAGDEIRASEGVYYWSGLARVTAKNITVKGGYAGLSEDETPDSETYKTIISGDALKDDRWVVHNIRERALNGKTNPERTLGAILEGGEVNIPELRNEWEIAIPDSTYTSDNVAILFVDSAAGTFRISDIWFVSAGTKGVSGQGSAFHSYAKSFLENIRFIGCSANESVVHLRSDYAKAVAAKNILIKGTRLASRGVLGVDSSNLAIDSIAVEWTYQTGSNGPCAVFLHSGSYCKIVNSRIERCFGGGSTYGPTAGVGSENHSFATIQNTVFRNNAASGSKAAAAANFSYKEQNLQMALVGCLIEKNIQVSGPAMQTTSPGIVNLGRSDGRIENCTVRDNEIHLKTGETTESVCGAPVILGPRDGSALQNAWTRHAINCTFSSNSVAMAPAKEGVDVHTASSILVNTALMDNPIEAVIANCTFLSRGAETPEIRWTGSDSSMKSVVINSLFAKEGDTASFRPVISDTPHALILTNSLVKGASGLNSDLLGGAIISRDPRLAPFENAGDPAIPLLRPAAKVPGIRSAIDLKRLAYGGNAVCLFYAENGEPIGTTQIAGQNAQILTDAAGVERPIGSSTLGATQKLSQKAENGFTLYLESLPDGAGSFTGDSVQVVSAGESTAGVTAVPSSGNIRFLGWQTPSGETVETSGTLPAMALSSDMHLLAVFSAPEVKYTFDLTGAGSFEDGSTVKEVLLSPGSALPELDYTIDKSICVPYGWEPPLPQTAGLESRTFTFSHLAKIHRIVRVDPEMEDDTGDGQSWATAMKDIQRAIDAAAMWTGEVWLKKGVYISSKTSAGFIKMKNNVRITGGFEGVDGAYQSVDEERASRCGILHRSVITADTALDDIWRGYPSNLNVMKDGAPLKVVSEGRLTEPELADGDLFAYPVATGSNGGTIFNNSGSVLDNTAVLDTVTVMGAKAMFNPVTAHPLIVGCTFLGKASIESDDWFEARNSTFSLQSVAEGIYITSVGSGAGSQATTLLDGCIFTNCITYGRGAVATQKAKIRLSGCKIIGCVGTGRGQYHGAALGCEQGSLALEGCEIADNLHKNGYGVAITPRHGAIVTNCVFRGNRLEQSSAGISDDVPVAILQPYGQGEIKMYGSVFDSNRMEAIVGTNAHNKNAIRMIVALYSSSSLLENCIFMNNSVSVESLLEANPPFGVTLDILPDTGATMIGCTFLDNTAPDGDIGFSRRTASRRTGIYNSIFWSGKEDYNFVSGTGAVTDNISIYDSTVKNFTGSADYIAYSENVSRADPKFTSFTSYDKDGFLYGTRLSGSSPVRRGGADICLDASGNYARKNPDGTYSYVTASGNPSLPLSPLADIFGDRRIPGKFSQGALQRTTPSSTILSVR